MRVWTIASQKGGSGKTTLALHLAIAAADNLKVLVIDLDPQQSAERWHAIRQRTTGKKDDPSIAWGPPTKLGDMLKTARRHDADLVLIDTPSKREKAIHTAIDAGDLVLVPTKSSILDLHALKDSADAIDIAKARSRALIIPNAVPTGRSKDTVLKDIQRYAAPLKIEVMAERLSELAGFAQG